MTDPATSSPHPLPARLGILLLGCGLGAFLAWRIPAHLPPAPVTHPPAQGSATAGTDAGGEEILPEFRPRTADPHARALCTQLDEIYRSGAMDPVTEEKYRALLLELAGLAPVDATRWFYLRHQPFETDDLIRDLVANAPESDFRALAEIHGSIPNGFAQGQYEMALMKAFAKKLPAECAAFLSAHPDMDQRAAAKPLEALLRTDPEAARDFIMANASASWMQSARRDAATALALSDPAGAVETLSKIEPAGVRVDMMLSAAHGMKDAEPALAGALALQLPVDRYRRELLGAVMSDWMQRDPEATAAWIRTNLKGPERNEAIADMLRRVGRTENPEILSLYDDLSTATLRKEAESRVAPVLAATLTPEDALSNATGWNAPGLAAISLRRYAEEVAAKDLPAALSMIRDERFPEKARIPALADAMFAQTQQRTDPDFLTAQCGEQAPEVAANLLARYRSNLSVAEVRKLQSVVDAGKKP